tara:strand:- start:2010 stop:2288 length:279 start_codon:yes stop_codon:yes gene_type:complete
MTLQRYEYDQNNSGGHFNVMSWDGPSDRGGVYLGSYSKKLTNVYVMAESDEEANDLAERYAGVYFNGCSDGHDCSCCGDRWYPTYGPVDDED